MATKTKGKALNAAPLQRLQKDGERLYHRLRKDAEALLARGRKELANEIRTIQRRGDAAARTLEAALLKRVHAASEVELHRLEVRVSALEERLRNDDLAS